MVLFLLWCHVVFATTFRLCFVFVVVFTIDVVFDICCLWLMLSLSLLLSLSFMLSFWTIFGLGSWLRDLPPPASRGYLEPDQKCCFFWNNFYQKISLVKSCKEAQFRINWLSFEINLKWNLIWKGSMLDMLVNERNEPTKGSFFILQQSESETQNKIFKNNANIWTIWNKS